ncbi:MAG: OB-fold domain-containing protein [Burkholderiales bacterium]
MSSLMEKSPLGVFQAHLAKGELAYQVCLDDNKPFFYPRAVAPATGSENIEWRVSKGLGTVYTTTAIHYKGEPPLNVAMIDLDEGFRMMSRVEDIDAMQVKIGMRVKFRVHPGDDKQAPYPVFTPAVTSTGDAK